MTDLNERLQHASLAVRERVGLLPLPDLTDRETPVSRKRPQVVAALGGLVVVLCIAGLTVFVVHAHPHVVTPAAATKPQVVDVDVHDLRPGTVLTSRYTYSAGELHHVPVFVARQNGGHVLAFLGRSTHLGCKLVLEDPAPNKRFTVVPNVMFVDPCGGSLWALNGACLGGPCPRSLDQFRVELVGASAHINLSQIIRGASRAKSSSPLRPACDSLTCGPSPTSAPCPAHPTEPSFAGSYCGPNPTRGNGLGPSGECTGRETTPPCAPGMIVGHYAYTLPGRCDGRLILNGRRWLSELPPSKPVSDMYVWVSVAAGNQHAGFISPNGSVGFDPDHGQPASVCTNGP